MSPRVPTFRALALSLALLGAADPAYAEGASAPAAAGEPTPEARAANARALELSRAGDFAGALEQFQRAYDLSPSYLILYNVAKMSAATRDHARALEAFERYLSEGGDEVETARRGEVEAEMDALRRKVGALSIEVDEEGAEIEVDGRSRGRAPLERPVWLNPGEHRVLVIGRRTESRRVRLDPGRTESLRVTLRELPTPPADPPSGGVPVGLRTAAWITTGVLAVGATVTGTLALVVDADLADDVYVGATRRPDDDSELAAKAGRLEALATTTDVLVVLGALTGAAAITLSIVDAATSTEQPAGGSAALRLGPGAILLEGRF